MHCTWLKILGVPPPCKWFRLPSFGGHCLFPDTTLIWIIANVETNFTTQGLDQTTLAKKLQGTHRYRLLMLLLNSSDNFTKLLDAAWPEWIETTIDLLVWQGDGATCMLSDNAQLVYLTIQGCAAYLIPRFTIFGCSAHGEMYVPYRMKIKCCMVFAKLYTFFRFLNITRAIHESYWL